MAFALRVEEQVDEAARKIALDALTRIVEKTPVDTGRARGNWQVSPIQPILTELDLGFSSPARVVGRGKKFTKQRQRNKTASQRLNAQQAAQLALKAGQAVIESQGRVTVLYITDNVPYILFLENGSSRQAPQGMVKLTAQELTSMSR